MGFSIRTSVKVLPSGVDGGPSVSALNDTDVLDLPPGHNSISPWPSTSQLPTVGRRPSACETRPRICCRTASVIVTVIAFIMEPIFIFVRVIFTAQISVKLSEMLHLCVMSLVHITSGCFSPL